MDFDDVGPPLGLRFEQTLSVQLGRRSHPAPALVVPLESSVVSVELGPNAGAPRFTVDKAAILLIPGDTSYRVTAKSPVTKLVTLVFHEAIRTAAATEYAGDLQAARFASLVEEGALLARTNWVNELCHRYVFERTVCEKHTSRAATFLETELAKELYFLLVERADRSERASLLRAADPVTERAVAYLEGHLFEALVQEQLCHHCGASASTVLRSFRRDLGCTPGAYLRGRRLDEARLLLRTWRYSVGEVAELVGYQSLASFTYAFRRRFGEPPSAMRRP